MILPDSASHRPFRETLALLVALLATFAGTARAENYHRNAATADEALASTFRLRAQQFEGNLVVTGHGSAFGIDLSKYGYERPRYLLTACHCVQERGALRPVLKVELRTADGSKEWVRCKVLAVDPELDICLMESEVDLPFRAELADEDIRTGSPLMLVGCPEGVPPNPFTGHLSEKDSAARSTAKVSGGFNHGCSGGPFFDKSNFKVIGLAVAGVKTDAYAGRDMDPHTGLFIPLDSIKQFVETRLPKRPLARIREESMPMAGPMPALTINIFPVAEATRRGIFVDPEFEKGSPKRTGEFAAPTKKAEKNCEPKAAVSKVAKPAAVPKDKPAATKAKTPVVPEKKAAAPAVEKKVAAPTPAKTPAPAPAAKVSEKKSATPGA